MNWTLIILALCTGIAMSVSVVMGLLPLLRYRWQLLRERTAFRRFVRVMNDKTGGKATELLRNVADPEDTMSMVLHRHCLLYVGGWDKLDTLLQSRGRALPWKCLVFADATQLHLLDHVTDTSGSDDGEILSFSFELSEVMAILPQKNPRAKDVFDAVMLVSNRLNCGRLFFKGCAWDEKFLDEQVYREFNSAFAHFRKIVGAKTRDGGTAGIDNQVRFQTACVGGYRGFVEMMAEN